MATKREEIADALSVLAQDRERIAKEAKRAENEKKRNKQRTYRLRELMPPSAEIDESTILDTSFGNPSLYGDTTGLDPKSNLARGQTLNADEADSTVESALSGSDEIHDSDNDEKSPDSFDDEKQDKDDGADTSKPMTTLKITITRSVN